MRTLMSIDIQLSRYMFSTVDMAISRRFLGFVSEVIEFCPSSRTLRVLVMRPDYPGAQKDGEFAAVFFAPGVRGVAVALWATQIPSGAAMPKALLKALGVPSRKFREVTESQEIHSSLASLGCALEAELRGTPKVALMLTSAFAGAAFDFAETVSATAHMPPYGNASLANYLAAFPTERKEPAVDEAVVVSGSGASPAPRPRQF